VRNTHRHRHVGEHGRLDVKALGERRIVRRAAAGEQPRAFLFGGVDIAHHALELHLGNDRPHGGGGIGRNAGPEGPDLLFYARQHGLVDLLMDEGAAGRAAGLPAPGEVHAGDDAPRHLIRIGVGISDQGILAAEFQHHGFHGFGGCAHHGASRRHAADQRHHRDVLVARKCRAAFLAAGNDIEHAGRQNAVDQLGQTQR